LMDIMLSSIPLDVTADIMREFNLWSTYRSGYFAG
jgi:hypothetical protein